MAGDYIPVTKTLPRKREVLAIATATGRSRSDVVLALLDFWFWVDDESVDGQLPGLTPSHLTGLFPGTDDAFWLAVISAGWLIQRTTGLEVPNFQRWLGQSAKRRLNEAEKKRQQRSKDPGPKHVPENVPKMSPKMSPKKRDKNGTREEKRREENTGEVSPDPSLPPPGGESGKKPRPRDELFDAVVEVTGADPKVNGSEIGRVCKVLRSADPPYTPAEIRALAAALAAHGYDFPITVAVVGKWIYLVRLKIHPGAPRSKGTDGDLYAGLKEFARRHNIGGCNDDGISGDPGVSQLGHQKADSG